MPFYLVQNSDTSKRVLLSESLSSVKFVNLVQPVEVIIGGIVEPATIAANNLLISTDGETWTEIINTIDFRIEFEPKIFVAPDGDSKTGTVQVLLASSAE